MLAIRAAGTARGNRRLVRLLTVVLAFAANCSAAAGNDHGASVSLQPGSHGEAPNVDGLIRGIEKPPYEELLLETTVNGLPPAVTLIVLRDAQQQLWLPADSFASWHMNTPARSVEFRGREFRLLERQHGLSWALDMPRLTLEIEAAPEWFPTSRVDGSSSGGAVPEADTGGFLNYDLNVTHVRSNSNAAGLVEAGAFNGFGVVICSALMRSGGSGAAGEGVVRLDTTWTRDMPERMASMRIGDAVGGASAWGRPVRFGGVQFATNFATQPGFITFPLPAMHGEAALPSTLDLYVNGVRRMTSEVPTGPFEIADLPTVTGQGGVQLVVTDLLGRQQIITDRFYVSSRLLQRGLHEFSYEAGAEREGYGAESFGYGRAFATGTHRYGFSSVFTGEARLELLSGQYTAGVGGALLLGDYGIAHGAVAGSHGDRGQGALAALGYEYSSRRFGFGFSLELASKTFVQLGLHDDRLAPRSRGQAFVTLPLKRAGSISLSYVRRDERDPDLGLFESLSASYQLSLGRIGHLGLYATRIQGMQDDRILGLNFTRVLGGRTMSSASGNFSNDSDQLVMQVQRSLPYGPGYGFHARAGLLDQDRMDVGVAAQNGIGTWQLDASRANGETGLRATASGGVAWLGGDLHFSRRMDDGFAVVEVGDFEGVRIYADNQHVATTDANGRALLPRLRAYERNTVRIEVGDLPIDAEIDQVEYEAVPYFRSGMVVEFDVSRSSNALFRLQRGGGERVPAGSVVTAPGGEQFPVGYDGEVFVTGLAAGTRLTAGWNGIQCEFELPSAESDDPLPDLGVLNCVETSR